MTDSLTIALAQINPIVGDLTGNADRIRASRADAAAGGADLVAFGELAICGYPPEDLVMKPAFIDACHERVKALAAETADGGPGLLIGLPWADDDKLFNAVALCDRGEIIGLRHKHFLPNYGVFDELRLFDQGPLPGPLDFRGVRIGVPICEDIWYGDVVECLEETGAEILLVHNGSPFDRQKFDVRIQQAVARVAESGLPMAYVNQVGGQDELVFDGASFVLNPGGALAVQMPAWSEEVVLTHWSRGAEGWTCREGDKALIEDGLAGIYQALMVGLRDYVQKNKFPSVVLGLSGGIDSALTAAVAADALGPDAVHCIMLPSRYTSNESLSDAADCAERLGVKLDQVAISAPVQGVEEALGPLFEGTSPDITEENIQSRLRGLLLMAVSNKFQPMVLTTGNKSEVSVGYATLYGDMCGGYNALKDIYKTEVFALCEWRNAHHPRGALGPAGPVIPDTIITKPPTAELREDQKDEDSLPPYPELDAILAGLVEGEKSVADLVDDGHDPDTVKRIENLLYISEYKRRQAAPGVKISLKNFGRDRRYPITNRFRTV
ncbi:MAG: NAD+ synthase [Pseudomonadota bacterium]